MERAAKPQLKAQKPETKTERPTISTSQVVATGVGSFSGWGPKVSSTGNILKNWN